MRRDALVPICAGGGLRMIVPTASAIATVLMEGLDDLSARRRMSAKNAKNPPTYSVRSTDIRSIFASLRVPIQILTAGSWCILMP